MKQKLIVLNAIDGNHPSVSLWEWCERVGLHYGMAKLRWNALIGNDCSVISIFQAASYLFVDRLSKHGRYASMPCTFCGHYPMPDSRNPVKKDDRLTLQPAHVPQVVNNMIELPVMSATGVLTIIRVCQDCDERSPEIVDSKITLGG
jgi:hypothetical protein